MAEIILDLSGSAGLADNFFGDTDTITPDPSKRISKKESDLVSGLFNPYLRSGYLAPISTTSVTVTNGTTPESQFIASEYDQENGQVILLDDTKSIFKLTSLTDISTELAEELSDNTYGSYAYEELYDAQIYEMNGERRLYVVGKSVPYGGQLLTYATTTGTAGIINTFSVRPSASTKPDIVYTERGFDASPSTSDTLSVTVPAGTDTCLFVVCFFSNKYNPGYIYSYGDSATMTKLGEGGQATGPGFITSYIANPAVGTYNVEVVGPVGGFSNLVMIAFVTDNTHQTDPAGFDNSRPTSQALSDILVYTGPNQLGVVAMYSNGIITLEEGYNSKEDDTQAYGSDVLAEVLDNPVSSLMIASLPLPSIAGNWKEHTWLASRATGGFVQELTRDYAFMRLADNGFAYVFAGNAVHKIDGGITGGEYGVVTENVLLFPATFSITDALDYNSRMYIAVHQYPVTVKTTSLSNYPGKCGIFVWNRISTQLSASDFIEMPGVREIKRIYGSPDNVLKLIVISENGLTELREFGYNDSGGAIFRTKKVMGIGAYPQLPDGLSSAGDKVVWLANDGIVYSEKGGAITRLFEAKTPGATTATMATNISSGIAFYGSGSETASSGFRSNKQGVLISYSDNHVDGVIDLLETSTGSAALSTIKFAVAQSFTPDVSCTLTSASFSIKREFAPTGYVYAVLYAHTGTFGSGATPSTVLASPIATSDPIDVSTIGTDFEDVVFTFSGAEQYELVSGTPYFLGATYTNAVGSNQLRVETNSTEASHVGNRADADAAGTWSSSTGNVLFTANSDDIPFILNKKIYPFDLTLGDNSSQTPNQGDVYTGVTYIPLTSVLRNLRIYNAPIPGTGTDVIATIKIYFNQSTTVGITKTITKDEAKRGYVDFHLNKPYTHAIQIEVEWGTSEALGSDTYLPSVAIITHDPTKTQSPDNG